MTEWIEYTGSDEQIKELNSAINSNSNGVLLKLKDGTQTIIRSHLYGYDFVAYLICNPHPLAGMICQQARTGQPVWLRKLFECGIEKEWQMFVTTTPNWNIPGAEYSFTEFKEEV